MFSTGAGLDRSGRWPSSEAGTVIFTRSEIAAWIQGYKAGEFDDLTTS